MIYYFDSVYVIGGLALLFLILLAFLLCTYTYVLSLI